LYPVGGWHVHWSFRLHMDRPQRTARWRFGISVVMTALIACLVVPAPAGVTVRELSAAHPSLSPAAVPHLPVRRTGSTSLTTALQSAEPGEVKDERDSANRDVVSLRAPRVLHPRTRRVPAAPPSRGQSQVLRI
jgi:hypothetical protein